MRLGEYLRQRIGDLLVGVFLVIIGANICCALMQTPDRPPGRGDDQVPVVKVIAKLEGRYTIDNYTEVIVDGVPWSLNNLPAGLVVEAIDINEANRVIKIVLRTKEK